MVARSTPTLSFAPRHEGPWLLRGALGGALGGLTGLLAASVTHVVLGGEALVASNALGATVVRWLQIGQTQAFDNFYPDATLGGVLLALIAGALVGAPLGALVARFPDDHPAAWGFVCGIALWAITRWVLAPALDPASLRVLGGWPFAAGHLAFGLSTGMWLGAVSPRRSPATGQLSRTDSP